MYSLFDSMVGDAGFLLNYSWFLDLDFAKTSGNLVGIFNCFCQYGFANYELLADRDKKLDK